MIIVICQNLSLYHIYEIEVVVVHEDHIKINQMISKIVTKTITIYIIFATLGYLVCREFQ